MPKFPSKEVDISTLAYTMLLGYIAHLGDFPNVLPLNLLSALKNYKTARDVQGQACAVVKLATDNKNASLDTLRELMKSCLKKSQVDVADSPEKLALIGWGSPKVPQSIEEPGQPNNLHSISQGQGNLTLKWDRPTCGGTIRNYIIERRDRIDNGTFGSWILAGSSLNTEIDLTDQPRGPQLEYRIKAINIGGESTPSNTVAVVL
jgi:hypothetical protein